MIFDAIATGFGYAVGAMLALALALPLLSLFAGFLTAIVRGVAAGVKKAGSSEG